MLENKHFLFIFDPRSFVPECLCYERHWDKRTLGLNKRFRVHRERLSVNEIRLFAYPQMNRCAVFYNLHALFERMPYYPASESEAHERHGNKRSAVSDERRSVLAELKASQAEAAKAAEAEARKHRPRLIRDEGAPVRV